jgi:hypothetical protein
MALSRTYNLGSNGNVSLERLGVPVVVNGVDGDQASVTFDEFDPSTPESKVTESYDVQHSGTSLRISARGDAALPAGGGGTTVISGGSVVIGGGRFGGIVSTGDMNIVSSGRRTVISGAGRGGRNVVVNDDGVWVNGRRVDGPEASSGGGPEPQRPRRVTLNVPKGTALDIDDAGNLTTRQLAGRIRAKSGGFGRMDLETTGEVGIKSNGSADFTVRGANGLNARLSGSGDLSASRVTGDVYIEGRGSGDVDLAGNMGDVTLIKSGSGDASLRGSAQTFSPTMRGSGDLDTSGLQVAQGRSSAPNFNW